jgi:hypothetical protein
MHRHYFISNNLDDLDRIENHLEHHGIAKPQIHVLSRDDAGVETHKHLHNIQSVFKQNVVNGTIVGAIIGVLAACLVIAVAYISKLPETYTWMPFYFLAVVLLGFSTWSGGFYGIQTPHKEFKRFQQDLANGKHVFIVDVDPSQENIINQLKIDNPQLISAGTGSATPGWVVKGQKSFHDITTTTFP